MADSVKIVLLKAIETFLREIPEIKTVLRWRETPVDLSSYEKPVLFFWEEEEREKRNRLALGKLDFWIQAFFLLNSEDPASYTTFTDTAENIAGLIQNKFAAPVGFPAAGLIQIEPGRVEKVKHNQEYGVLFMTYTLTYGHAAGDAFSTIIP